MAQRLKEVDVVVIGVGMVGSIVAKELAAAGYKWSGWSAARRATRYRSFKAPPSMTSCVSPFARP